MNLLKSLTPNTKNVLLNSIGAFGVKGAGLLVSFYTLPAYLKYFHNNIALGVWYTILSIISWVFLFDFGIGHGLRNLLTVALTQNKILECKKYISSAYISLGAIAIVLCLILNTLIPFVNWNKIFNVSSEILASNTLDLSMQIIASGLIIEFVLRLITSILYALQKSALVNALILFTNVLIMFYLLMAPDCGMQQNLINLSLLHVFATNIPLFLISIIIFMTYLKNMRPSILSFDFYYAKSIWNIGIVLFWLQFIWLVVTAAQPIIISHFISAEAVVEYQLYYKIYNTFAALMTLLLTPMWSAITKAQAEQNFLWIRKTNNIFLLFVLVLLIIELIFIPLLPLLFNIWLGKGVITANIFFEIIMSIFSAVFVWHNVNTSFGNGMSLFRIQNIWMTFAAIVIIPLSWFFCKLTVSWIGVVIGATCAVLPYECIWTIYFRRYIKKVTVDILK